MIIIIIIIIILLLPCLTSRMKVYVHGKLVFIRLDNIEIVLMAMCSKQVDDINTPQRPTPDKVGQA